MDGVIAYYGGLKHFRRNDKTTTRAKLIMLVARNISQTTSEKNKDAIRESYTGDTKYLAFS